MEKKPKKEFVSRFAPPPPPPRTSLLSTCGKGEGVKQISSSPYRNAAEHIFPGKVQEDVELSPEALMEPYESEGACRDTSCRGAA